jgi:hypothetical protein
MSMPLPNNPFRIACEMARADARVFGLYQDGNCRDGWLEAARPQCALLLTVHGSRSAHDLSRWRSFCWRHTHCPEVQYDPSRTSASKLRKATEGPGPRHPLSRHV